MDCQQAQELLGAEPSMPIDRRPAELAAHVSGCAACDLYAQQMRQLDQSIKRALEVDLTKFRTPGATLPAEILESLAKPAVASATVSRRGAFAMAASVLLVLAAGASFWALRADTVIAGELVEHMADEVPSWNQTTALPQSAIDLVLRQSGVRVDSSRMPVVYAHSCTFRGHNAPHLVVSTNDGPRTVILLRDEHVWRETRFDEGGYRGVLWPAPDGRGSIAVLAREASAASAPADLAEQARRLSTQMEWTK